MFLAFPSMSSTIYFGVPQAVRTIHKLIKPLIAATNRDGAGQLPRVEGAGEHHVQAGAAAVWTGLEGQRGEVTSSWGIL